MGNTVYLHDSYKPGIVHFRTDDTVLQNQFKPFLEGLRRIVDDREHQLKLLCITIRASDTDAQAVHINWPSAYIPELNDVLRGQTQYVLLAMERLNSIYCRARGGMVALNRPQQNVCVH
jgi:hypothetical protein